VNQQVYFVNLHTTEASAVQKFEYLPSTTTSGYLEVRVSPTRLYYTNDAENLFQFHRSRVDMSQRSRKNKRLKQTKDEEKMVTIYARASRNLDIGIAAVSASKKDSHVVIAVPLL
jgi:hypothetical protein